jgi:DNA-binding transcriptional ArsR family regulator
MANHIDGFVALSDPTRRRVFERLSKRPLAVGDLARRFPVSRPAISQHLKVLLDAGLVTSQSSGTRRLYRVDPRGVAAMRGYLDRFWEQSLAAFKTAVEKEHDS